MAIDFLLVVLLLGVAWFFILPWIRQRYPAPSESTPGEAIVTIFLQTIVGVGIIGVLYVIVAW